MSKVSSEKPIISSESPNMRFGTTFLDTIYRDRAVNDEGLFNKRTGEVVYKRNTDGKLVTFTQDNVALHQLFTQLKILIDTNVDYIRPTTKNCEAYNDTYFIANAIDMMDFYFSEEQEKQSLLEGGVMLNPYPYAYNFTQEMNGFFVELSGRPRDRGLIGLLTAIYNNYYRDYKGTDAAALKEKDKFKTKGYEDAQATIQYEIKYYQNGGRLVDSSSGSADIRLNELSYVPFLKKDIYPRSTVSYATISILSVQTPKLAMAMDILKSTNQQKLLDTFTDSNNILFSRCIVTSFITTTDEPLVTPPDKNSFPIAFMSLPEFETEMNRIGNISNSSGIIASTDEPDEVGWAKTMLWAELIRDVITRGDTEDRGAKSDFKKLEDYFGSEIHQEGNLTEDPTDLEGYLVQALGASTLLELG